MKLSKYLKDQVTLPNGDISVVLTPEGRYLAEIVKTKNKLPYHIGEDGSYHFVVPGGDSEMLNNLIGYIHSAHEITSQSKRAAARANYDWNEIRDNLFDGISADAEKTCAALEQNLRNSGMPEEKMRKILNMFRSDGRESASQTHV